MSKTEDTAWLVIFLLLGITAIGLVMSFLMGHPRSMNIIGKVWVHFIGFCAINGAYISFKVAMSGLDEDKPIKYGPGARTMMGLSGMLVLALVWGGIWLVSQ
ncbi:hypothetical protein JQ604_22465 [Bradyrhizobium jicamae]|uniref:hypothetical protein n=1 Tax=Bradyrhizobium jicamae TaxID=280332 RepID=UPI001BAD6727|nr:hypothetical protein [Bradyrhizobium jicamae]MBR0754956.1 hypothetical protein [Bradyrhizobium jicamae]